MPLTYSSYGSELVLRLYLVNFNLLSTQAHLIARHDLKKNSHVSNHVAWLLRLCKHSKCVPFLVDMGFQPTHKEVFISEELFKLPEFFLFLDVVNHCISDFICKF